MDGAGELWGRGKAAQGNDRGMACVKVGQSKLEMFHVCKGARQGCTLSPWLFNVFIDEVQQGRQSKTYRWSEAVCWRTGSPPSNLKAMSEVLSRWELNVNWKKTKVTIVVMQKGRCEVRIGDMEIEQVMTHQKAN